ncbi:MAG TPA: phosphate ABC transporter ATP-binding protein [Candidatus Binatia bacterium]|nr:phosphate ABC transporter ATP-binding protein [Candidatus Binatia bacterium]
MAEALFSLEGVNKIYDGRCVLAVEHLQIARGEILAVVGPSGAGKSTLLRLLNFLETPTTGKIRFGSQLYDAARMPDVVIRRRITTVFQRPILLKRSVRANVQYGLTLRGTPRRDALVDDVLEQVGMSALAEKHARNLSGGEAQRVALARAMIVHPEVLLLDEPTANLDPYNVGLIEEIMRGLNERERTTLVLVTHNVFQARRLAHRVAFLLDGELVEVAGASSFFDRPEDARTAAFVAGDMVY